MLTRMADAQDRGTGLLLKRDLLRRVCTVSVKTMEIVEGMAYWDGDNLVALGDRGGESSAR